MKYNFPYDIKYAGTRLDGTISTMHGLPSYILEIKMNGIVRHRPTSTMEYTESDIEDLDPTPVHVGFVNRAHSPTSTRNATYYSRMPLKQYLQGLTNTNTYNVTTRSYDFMYTVQNFKKPFEKSYLNQYPSLEEAAEILRGEEGTVAFCKELALTKHLDVYNSVEKVGFLDSGELVFNKGFEFYSDYIAGV